MLWWSMLEVALAAIAACLPSFSFFTKDGRLSKAFYRILSFSNLSGSLSRWQGKSEKASSDANLKPEVGLDSYQMPNESWTNGNVSVNSGRELGQVIYIQDQNESKLVGNSVSTTTSRSRVGHTEPKSAYVHQRPGECAM